MTQKEYDKILRYCWDRELFIDVKPLKSGYSNKRFSLILNYDKKEQLLKNDFDGTKVFNRKSKEKDNLNIAQRTRKAYINAYEYLKKLEDEKD